MTDILELHEDGTTTIVCEDVPCDLLEHEMAQDIASGYWPIVGLMDAAHRLFDASRAIIVRKGQWRVRKVADNGDEFMTPAKDRKEAIRMAEDAWSSRTRDEHVYAEMVPAEEWDSDPDTEDVIWDVAWSDGTQDFVDDETARKILSSGEALEEPQRDGPSRYCQHWAWDTEVWQLSWDFIHSDVSAKRRYSDEKSLPWTDTHQLVECRRVQCTDGEKDLRLELFVRRFVEDHPWSAYLANGGEGPALDAAQAEISETSREALLSLDYDGAIVNNVRALLKESCESYLQDQFSRPKFAEMDAVVAQNGNSLTISVTKQAQILGLVRGDRVHVWIERRD